MLNMMTINIPYQLIREGDIIVAVCPILDVSAYGDSEKEAVENFKHALHAFIDETTEHHTLEKVLEEHGWKKVQAERPRWDPPQVISSVRYEEISLPA